LMSSMTGPQVMVTTAIATKEETLIAIF
jgi:hypothetical protein